MHDLDPERFATHKAIVRGNVEIAYVHEGIGGVPLLMLHGWPGSKRLFWRNIEPLSAMGFEVIVPDQRGFGESSASEAGMADLVANSRDMAALLSHLGHSSCVVAAGDMGSAVAIDMGHRFPGLVRRQVIYNGATPFLPDRYLEAGLPESLVHSIMERSDHFQLHGERADSLAAELDTEEKRLAYVEGVFLGTHVWREGCDPIDLAGPGNFDQASARFQAKAISSADTFRSALRFYEGVFGPPEACSEAPILDRPISIETMVLWGNADGIVTEVFPDQLAIACENLVGPYHVPGVGHFLQWEAAGLLNASLRVFCRDLLGTHI